MATANSMIELLKSGQMMAICHICDHEFTPEEFLKLEGRQCPYCGRNGVGFMVPHGRELEHVRSSRPPAPVRVPSAVA